MSAVGVVVDYFRREELRVDARAAVEHEVSAGYRAAQQQHHCQPAAGPQVVDGERQYDELYHECLEYALAARRAEIRIVGLFLEDALEPPPTPTPEGHPRRDAAPQVGKREHM